MIGSASFVGERLRLLLEKEGYDITAFSRQGGKDTVALHALSTVSVGMIENWLYLAPIWTLPEHFELLEDHGGKRLVALSSTSRFTKIGSNSTSERALACRLQEGEEKVLEWARLHGWTVVILQPTLIYGLGKDKNVTEIAQFIQRFGFFPLFGRGEGLRQPVHVDDVSMACVSALNIPEGRICTYVLSGEDVVSYRTMVERIFTALGRKPRFIRCPLIVFTLAVRLANLFPPYKGLTTEMAVRMNKDQHFDHTAAGTDLGFQPRSFHPLLSDFTAGC
ncbi:MAG: NAD(P)-dependent oxidoreductase [Desulfobulbaceae bacterium]|nr:NAD(P)-dependent oxidoreductase [Desulfobulbaceae bacterium]